MKTLLLVCCLVSLPVLIIAEEQKPGIGPKTKKHKAPKFKEEDNVLVLTGSNFSRALKENKYLLVKFCKYSGIIFNIIQVISQHSFKCT